MNRLDFVNPLNIYRVYKENDNLILLTVDNRKTIFSHLNKASMKNLIEELQAKFKENYLILEVYNGLDEAKSRR